MLLAATLPGLILILDLWRRSACRRRVMVAAAAGAGAAAAAAAPHFPLLWMRGVPHTHAAELFRPSARCSGESLKPGGRPHAVCTPMFTIARPQLCRHAATVFALYEHNRCACTRPPVSHVSRRRETQRRCVLAEAPVKYLALWCEPSISCLSCGGRAHMQGEGQALVSALAIALSNSRVGWPAFVPVHDALRDAVAGVAAVGRRSVLLHADGMPAIRAAKQPPALLQARHVFRVAPGRVPCCGSMYPVASVALPLFRYGTESMEHFVVSEGVRY